MGRVSAIQTNFTAGEISPRLHARIDIQKFRNAAKTIENFIVQVHGGALKRPGFQYVSEVKASANPVRLVPFEFNTEQAYMLEFGPNYIRFYKDKGVIVYSNQTITGATNANPCVITSASHGFADGDHVLIQNVGGMTQLNNRRFTVAGAATNTFQLSGLDSTSYGTYTSGGTASEPVEVATTYSASELDDLYFTQSADTLYIAHPAHKLAKLTRSSHTSWTLSDADIKRGPFRSINEDPNVTFAFSNSGSFAITGATQANPCVITTSSAHGLNTGECVRITSVLGMTQLNNNYYYVVVLSSTTFSLKGMNERPVNASAYTAYTAGGVADRSITLFGTMPPNQKINVTASSAVFNAQHVGGLFRVWEPGKGPNVAQPAGGDVVNPGSNITNDGKVYGVVFATNNAWQASFALPSHEQGVVHVTGYNSNGSFREAETAYLHDSSAVLRIDSYISTTSVTATVVHNHVPKATIDYNSSLWEEGAWSAYRGYPGTVTFFEQRLWAAGNTAEPQTVWASVTSGFENFQDGADDDDALIYKIVADKVESIKWMVANKQLALGTASSEFVVSSGQDAALTPKNVRVQRHTTYGSGTVKPVQVGPSVIFGQRTGLPADPCRKIREFVYSFNTDSYVAADLSILSEHITGAGGIVEIAHQATPESIIWGVRADGVLAAMTYEREQQVVGWHRHPIAGTAAAVERIAVIPSADGGELWAVIARTIDGATKRYVEVLTRGLTIADDKEDGVYLDSALTYSGASTTSITGLWHLEGETVNVLNNGAVEAGKTVTNGTITLSTASNGGPVHVGLGYTSILESLDVEAGAQAGTAQMREKRISQAYIRLYRALGGTVGPDAAHQDEIIYRTPADPMNASPPLFSGYKQISMPSNWDRESHVMIRHSDPLPMNVLGVVVDINTIG